MDRSKHVGGRHGSALTSVVTRVPARFAIFALLCVAWAAAMVLSDAFLVDAAGVAWFLNWTTQISVTLASWAHPFSLPERYYRLADHRTSARPDVRSHARLYGLWIFETVVRRINPFSIDRRSFATLDGAMRAAETTHVITFTVGVVLAMGLAVAGSLATAIFLTIWNVILNLYAIALQRQNRARVRQAAQRRAERLSSERLAADSRLRSRRSAAASSSL